MAHDHYSRGMRDTGLGGRPWLWRVVGVLALLGGGIALFYVIENGRGKPAWERARTELQAKGARLDWSDFLPPEIPDEQNIFTAPNMQRWFVKGESSGGNQVLAGAVQITSPPLPAKLRALEVRLVERGQAGPAAISLTDPALEQRVQSALRDSVGPFLEGAKAIFLCARPLGNISPGRLELIAEKEPALDALKGLLAKGSNVVPLLQFTIQPGQSNVLEVRLNSAGTWTSAADYLAATAIHEPEFEMIRQALQRPYARMDGDYAKPFASPVPNFVAMRNVAQVLAQRAQCYLLLGDGEAAARDLILARQLCRLLEGEPTGRPMTLVAAMINVAISGLYASVVQNGLELGVWQEPQLRLLQEESRRIDLLPHVRGALEAERAAVCHILGSTKGAEFAELFSGPGGAGRPLVVRLIHEPGSVLISAAPQGWRYRNMITVARLHQQMLEAFDLTNRVIYPAECQRLSAQLSQTSQRFSVNTFLATMLIPNVGRACETMARNQAMATHAMVACGLERARLATGEYPGLLESVVPAYVERLPRDVVIGKPLQYRRNNKTSYALYSVGWNGRDDGGLADDWVWEMRAAGHEP